MLRFTERYFSSITMKGKVSLAKALSRHEKMVMDFSNFGRPRH